MKTLMKISLITIVLVFNVSILNAQTITWQKVFGGPQITQESRFGIQAFDGDYVILYLKYTADGGTYLLDLDPYGNERWNKRIDSTQNDIYIQQVSDSGFMLCGEGNIAKVDRLGNGIWKKSIRLNNQNLLIYRVKVIDSGDLLLCGVVAAISGSGFVMKTDSLGNIIWQKTLNQFNEPGVGDIIYTKDGFIYFTGTVKVNGHYKTLFGKMNLEGEFIWVNYYGSEGVGDSQVGLSIISESNTELNICGAYSRGYSTQGHFTKIDSSGNVIFQNVIPFAREAFNMCKTSRGNYAIAGSFWSWSTISDEMQFLLLNNNGIVLSSKLYNSFGDHSDVSCSIFETSDKGFLISGSTTYRPDNLAGTKSLFIVKTDSSGEAPVSVKTISNEIPAVFNLYQNYPNPFNPVTKIKFDVLKSGIVKVEIFDNTGKKIQTILDEKKAKGSYELNFEGSNLSSGIYYYKLTVQDYSSTRKMLLLK